uniref:TEP1-F n=1 Tax=Anopheles minimus TaxID=112268 RepID=A0A182W9G3_9DIPT
MWQFIRSRILTVIIFIGAAHGMLVVGPKFIRADQNYTVVLSNFNSNMSKVDLKIRLEGYSDDGTNVLSLTKSLDVRKYSTRMVTFNLPEDLSAGNYTITIDGHDGFNFHKEADLVYTSKTIYGFIQINKPVFKPDDTVQFRVIILDNELKPPVRVETIHVQIHDPENNVIREWPSAQLHTGVFEDHLQISPPLMLGIWRISALVDEEELVLKTFEVKKYVLSAFDLEVIPSTIPLEAHQGLNLTITANYRFGKPVNGLAKVKLYLEDDELDQRKELQVHGTGQMELRFKKMLLLNHTQQDVRVKTTFIEEYTNRTVRKVSHITVHKYKYHVKLLKGRPQFLPELHFECVLQFRNHDGTPATGITGEVKVDEIGYHETATSDNDGLIKLELLPNKDINEMTISFSNDDGFFFEEQVEKVEGVTDTFIKLELTNPVKLNQTLRFTVRCNEQMTFFVYYVVSKGNIIESGYMRPNKQTKFPLQLKATEKMVPKAKIIVSTIVNQTVVYDFVDIDFKDLRNNFHMTIDEEEVKPGRQIELRMSGRPGAYVGLAAYDQGLLVYNKNHDLLWENVMQVFDECQALDEHEFDNLHSMGLFGRTFDGIEFSGAHDTSSRYGSQENSQIKKLVPYRTNFPESWLWENVTIARSGKRSIIRVVPDTTTSWYLTGFSIDPVYGLGIIKKPIQLTTIQPFYIVESLPYSIKRDEAVVLQFTLFNNLGGEYIADVTLYNVANQTEFIGRPVDELSYTKSVTVLPKVGVPISFLVKARKLGEMVVRVKASIMHGLETDALEKIIRVVPETLKQSKMDSRIFRIDSNSNQSFRMNLYVNPAAISGSTKVDLQVNANLITTVSMHNLQHLLYATFGDGEQNMFNLGPNIVVLDYLNAIGSKDQNLIDKATSLIRQGFQNQLRYRQSDGSFGVRQNRGGSVFLTAFVAKSMQTASKYISEVDAAMVEKACDWLAGKYYTGSFYEGDLRSGIALTSYVLTALLENEHAKVKHAGVIKNAMDYLSQEIDYINSIYDLSIATYALMLNGHSKKDKALKKLIGRSTATNDGTERYWNSIETTSYALLSLVIAERYADCIPVMRWLVKQSFVAGSSSRTQDTFVGLTALTKLAEKMSPSRNNYTIQLMFEKSYAYSLKVSQDTTAININLPGDTKTLDINVFGVGSGLLEVFYQYSLNLMNVENQFRLDLTQHYTGSNNEIRLKVCASFIPKEFENRSNMTLVEVMFPSGFEYAWHRNLDRSGENPIQKIEISNTEIDGNSVILYYDSIGSERNCFVVTAYWQRSVALKHSTYVIVTDYYNPSRYAVKLYDHRV